MRRLAEANEEINKGGSAARFLELLASLRTQYDLVAEPEMEFLRAQKVVMGDRYPEAMFLAPKLVDDNTVAQMLGAMRVGPDFLVLKVFCPAGGCGLGGEFDKCFGDWLFYSVSR